MGKTILWTLSFYFVMVFNYEGFGFQILFSKTMKNNSHQIKRPPVVTLLGHIDHGKTSLLDKIFLTHIAKKEIGGITQNIHACQIKYEGYPITFIDTPGHQAFSAMRSRGAQITDIAILVIAATEGIKEQTKECIKMIVENQIPTIVVLNKIDLLKDQFLLEKIKKELSKYGLIIEEWGGKTPLIKASAQSGEGIKDLLEIIILLAETLELKTDKKNKFSAVVLESELSAQEGHSAILLIQSGFLKTGDKIFSANSQGKIKAIFETFSMKKITKAGPSLPIRVLGLKQSPAPGTIFSHKKILANSLTSDTKIDTLIQQVNQANINAPQKFNLILKAQTPGSLEAIINHLASIHSQKITLNILDASIGQINKNDISKAQLTKSAIFTFKIKTSTEKMKEARDKKINLQAFDIIFQLKDALIQELKNALPNKFEEIALGKIKVLALFETEKNGQIIGSKVLNGEIKKGSYFKVNRNQTLLPEEMKIINLEHNKKTQNKVQTGLECGLKIEGKITVKQGDILECFEKKSKENEL